MASDSPNQVMQILLVSAEEERVLFALNMALVAAVSNAHVTIFFALGSARWVCAGHADQGPISDLLKQLMNYDVELHCCSACAHKHCESEGEHLLIENVRQAGMASVVQRTTGACPTITV